MIASDMSGDTKTERFYSVQGGDRLVDPNNYPDEIVEYLNKEADLIRTILHTGNYTTLFEVGCMNARNLSLAVEHGIHYFGIDIVERYIEESQKEVSDRGNSIKAAVKCMSVCDLTKDTALILQGEKPLCIFPFNAFGNVSNVDLAVDRLVDLGLDILISTYRNDAETQRTRYEYYLACKYKNLRCITSEDAVIFSSEEGFHSVAYSESFIRRLLTSRRYIVKVFSIGAIGAGYLCLPMHGLIV
jgi:SAM-dependent methyltransferase